MEPVVDLYKLPELDDAQLTRQLMALKEDFHTEIKEASQLPASVWETFSSFANTNGGNIVLGVRELPEGNLIVGVANPDKILTDLWNSMSNENKISQRVLSNSDICRRSLDGKWILILTVKEASLHQKPVFLKNKLENTYLRTGDGDRKATTDEIAAMLRNTSNNADAQVLEGLTLSDLDELSLARLRSLIETRYRNKNLGSLSDEDFLIRIGAARRNRRNGEFSLFAGTLLMIGKTNVIKEMFPHFHLDYFEYQNGSSSRWDFRISDDDYLNEEVNLLSFYERVIQRMAARIHEPFQLDDKLIRLPDGGSCLISLREALVNALIHSDYQMADASVRIDARDDQFVFKNPGQMLIPASDFFTGGSSRPRNEVLMKLFRMAGFAERQGFGGSQIYSASLERDLKLPEITSDLSQTRLTIFTAPSAVLADSESDYERIVFQLLSADPDKPFSFSELKKMTGLSEHHLRKSIRSLLEKSILEKTGRGRGIRYHLKT